jgi:hypothetical protein
MRLWPILLSILIVQANVAACASTNGRPGTGRPAGAADSGVSAACTPPTLAASAAAASPWIRMALPEMTARELLVSLQHTDVGFLALLREQLGVDAKTLQGFRHRLLVSSDGIEWKERLPSMADSVDPAVHFNAASAGARQLVAVGGSVTAGGGAVWSAEPNNEWMAADFAPATPLMGIEWSALGFLAFGDGGTVLISADGQKWTEQKYAAAQLRSVACSPTTCVFGGTTNLVVLDVRSRRGSTSTLDCNAAACISDPSGKVIPPPVDSVVYGHEEFYVETQDIGMDRSAFASRDGAVWRKQELAATPQAFIRELAVRATGPGQIAIWNKGDAQRPVTVINDNASALSCSAFDCVILNSSTDSTLLLIPSATKVGDCD